MLELRILSGLHRGATLPLIDEELAIGSGDDSDVVLVDPGICDRHAVLSATGDAWVLTAEKGELRAADTNSTQAILDLSVGDFARIGKVWITIVESGSPWQDPPAEPLEIPFDASAVSDFSEPIMSADSLVMEVPSDKAGKPAAIRKRFGWKGKKALAVPVMATSLLFVAAAAYAMTSRSNNGDSSKRLEDQATAELTKSAMSRPKLGDSAVDISAPSVTPLAASSAPESQEELRKAFRNRLADAQLLKRFELNLRDDSWEMRGNMDDEETVRFERILKAFMSEHKISFPVHAKVVTAEGMLPFKIRQVISGASAAVVTDDGTRLYLGDEYKGIKVVAIQDNHLTFAGKRKIEVNW